MHFKKHFDLRENEGVNMVVNHAEQSDDGNNNSLDRCSMSSNHFASTNMFCEMNESINATYSFSTKEPEKRHDMTLDLSLGNKADNIFVADLTPTPTCLIRNCEEVGLFEDLQHVNPFDEGFRRAVELQSVGTPATTITAHTETHTETDSLHTPQVYPLDATAGSDFGGLAKSIESQSPLDLPIVDSLQTPVTSRQNSLQAVNPIDSEVESPILTDLTGVHLPTSIQLIQPQVITWMIPANSEQQTKLSNTAIPVQTVRPFILPKPTTTTTATTSVNSSGAVDIQSCISITANQSTGQLQPQHEPSSASLTPTSQLPIKERLKAILNNNNKLRSFETTTTNHLQARSGHSRKAQTNDDCMERRRAAATRYRNKMRNEHNDLRQKNSELQTENKNLRQRIYALEQKLKQQQQAALNNNVPQSQIQIPSSSIHLVINVPKLLVPSNNEQQPVLQNPITYRLEKK